MRRTARRFRSGAPLAQTSAHSKPGNVSRGTCCGYAQCKQLWGYRSSPTTDPLQSRSEPALDHFGSARQTLLTPPTPHRFQSSSKPTLDPLQTTLDLLRTRYRPFPVPLHSDCCPCPSGLCYPLGPAAEIYRRWETWGAPAARQQIQMQINRGASKGEDRKGVIALAA